MVLQPIKNIEQFKNDVKESITTLSSDNPSFEKLVRLLMRREGLFLIGGYLRNIANKKANSRDVDLISTRSTSSIISILNSEGLKYSVNRMDGIKVVCDNINVDLWSISKNWSFNKDRVKWDSNTHYRLDILIKKIADGSFYNFDSLVLNLNTYACSVSNYNDFVEKEILDILRKKGRYKYQNPTREANILRAYFISNMYKIILSDNVKTYIIKELKNIESLKSQKAIDLILRKSEEYKEKYQSSISEKELIYFLSTLQKDSGPLFNH